MKMIFFSIPALKIKLLFVFIFLSLLISANNIQIKSPARVVDVTGGMATIEVSVSWDNSWRDTENWDAAYLFLKYRVAGGNWAHVPIQLTGNVISAPYTYMTATPSWTTAPGVFIYRDELDAGPADVTCKLRWNTGYSQQQFDEGQVEILAQAIEMVFVPAGGYMLGDSLSANSFADSYGHPVPVRTEASNLTVGYKNEGGVYENVTVAGSYPKGYQGFYVMKYEVSQEQYVTFLNTLTLNQQKTLLPGWSSWKEGDYIFGSPSQVSNRNGIVMAYHVKPDVPMIFANNFNPANEYNSSDDGQTLACNYMSIYDLLSYSAWAGLRPMSEMEFEKVCRPLLPEPLVKGGYAWNGGSGTTQKAQGITSAGSEGEAATVGNVNFRNGVDGPVRSGIFAGIGTNQQTAGATYWGAMEMSGNVQELCRNVNDWWFYWNVHGDGSFNPGIWSSHLPYYSLRGGSFASGTDELRVSDRRHREYFTGRAVTFRDSTVGFRAVRTLEFGAIDLNPGTISALTTICPNVELTIASTEGASVKGMNNMSIRYEWYLNSVLLEGETADTLHYSDWQPNTYYNFVRKAVCPLGEKFTNTVRVYVVAPELKAGTITGGTRCNTGMLTVKNTLSAHITCEYPVDYTWYIDGVLFTDSLGQPWTADTLSREWEIGSYNVVRRATGFGIVKDASTTVNVTDLRLNAGQIYGGQVTETVEKLIASVKDASVGCGGFTYYWLIDSVVINGEHEAELRHAFDTPGFYQVIRRVISDDSTMMDAMDTIIVNSKSAICGRLDSIVVDDQENVYTVLPMADDRCWMTQNMRRRDISHQHAGLSAAAGYDGDNIKYHEGVQANDSVYGLHYNWNVAMQGKTTEKSQGICPAGWYIPTDEEWRTLEIAYGMEMSAATGTGWRGTNQGTQFKTGGSAKFKITLSGYAATSYFGSYGYYWTSTQDGGSAWVRHFTSDPRVYRYEDGKGNMFSIRCIRSKCLGGAQPKNLYPGVIKGGTAGVGFPYMIKTLQSATVSCGGIEYSWYINDTLVAGRGASLTYVFPVQGVYNIVRRATADDNSYADTMAVVRVFPACGTKNYVLDDQAHRYDIKEMGDARCWMIQNMRRTDISHQHAGLNVGVDVDGSNLFYHEGVQKNDTLYGCHYNWSVAMQGATAEKSQGICPPGWYIPTDAEWKALEMAYGMTQAQANGTGYRGYNEATQFKVGGTSGFNITLSGYAATSYFGSYGYYWTSTQDGGSAWVRHFTSDPRIYRYEDGKGNMWSVRCIRSMCYESAPQDLDPGKIQGGSSSMGYPITVKNIEGATVSCGGLDYTWYLSDTLINGEEGASLTYTFEQAGVYYLKRRATADNGDYAEAIAKVVVYAPCGPYNYVLDQQGRKYSVKEMADGRCWMTQNMRRTDISHQHAGLSSGADVDGSNLFYHEGVQTNDSLYGCHYNWSVAMQGATAEKSQGICPPGWYIPTDAEWKTLSMAYGMTQAQANGTGYQGYNESTQFKVGGSSGFNITLSGYAATSYFGKYGYYWTSTQDGGSAWVRHFTSDPRVYRYEDGKGNMWSVRCIRSRCEDGEEPDSIYSGKITGGLASPGYSFTIKNAESAQTSCGGLYYSWYINGVEVERAYGESLTYTFDTSGRYTVERHVLTDNALEGIASAVVTVGAPCLEQEFVRDDQGHVYKIKAMADNRCWMIQNMRRTDIAHQHANLGVAVDVDGSNLFYHEGIQANDSLYGCHYNWNVAMQGATAEKSQGICPPGWYIPTDVEWKTLSMAYGMTQAQANGTGYQGYNESTQFKVGGSSGFNITLSGYAATSYFGKYGYYWTSTQDGGSAWGRHFTSDPRVYRLEDGKGNMWSVRCIRSVCMEEDPSIITAGVIQGGSTAANYPIKIKQLEGAKANCGGLFYSWYINDVLVPDETAATMIYTFDSDGVYIITRRVTADDHSYQDAIDTVRVFSPCSGDTCVYDDQGHVYTIKAMADNRCWMTQNMRRTDISHQHAGLSSGADVDGSNLFYHEGVQTNDSLYGCHYNWSIAMQGATAEKSQGICPPGWYIPTDAEWKTLSMAYGMTQAQANGTGYQGYNESTQFKVGGSSGFNITLSGYAATSYFGKYGYYWTSTQDGGSAWVRHFTSDPRVYRYEDGKGNMWSVRCIRSTCFGATPEILSPGAIKGGNTAVNYPITIKNLETGRATCGALKYSWFIDGDPVYGVKASSLTYTFVNNGKYKVTRKVTSDNGSSADTSVWVQVYSPCAGNTTVTDDQGHVYKIKAMADNRCWMIQNMRRTDIAHQHANLGVAVDVDGSNLFYHEGVQANDSLYGCHYNWNVAMQGATAEKSQGICPPGWYIPTDVEWKTLSMAYGMTQAQANGTGYQGYNESTQFKVGGSSGFNITLSGYAATSYFGKYGYYWTSTQDGGSAWGRHFTSDPRVYRLEDGKGNMWSVRCIKETCFDENPTITSAGEIKGGITGRNYPITIKSVKTASSTCGGLRYSWYVDGSLMSGENGSSLVWSSPYIGTYEIIRRATMDDDVNNYQEVSTEVTVYSPCVGKEYVDDAQGNRYTIKEMADTRCWMTQNIRRTDVSHQHPGVNVGADVDGSNLFYHEGIQKNDTVYGCHYNWNVAMQGATAEKSQGICPPGWYIPTDTEWKTLSMAYGMTQAQANGTGYQGYNEATQFKVGGSSGFNITLSGYAATSYFGSYGYYWTSSQDGGNSWVRHFTSEPRVYRYSDGRGNMWSVRCIRSQCYNGDMPLITSPGKIVGGRTAVNYPITIKGTETATVTCGGLEYSWYIGNATTPLNDEVGQSLTYTFDAPGVYILTRRVTDDMGHYRSVSDTVRVYSPCAGNTTVTDAQGHVYTIKAMADNRCWMTQNMRRTDVAHQHANFNAAADVDGSNLFYHEGEKDNDVAYGCHYNWTVAMQGATAEKSQGICPPGWYIPTDAEWKTLEMAYGMTKAQADGTAYRGYNEATQFKVGGTSDFNITLSGYAATSYFGKYGYYWTSTQDGGSAWVRHFTNEPKVYRYEDGKGNMWSVRCIKETCFDENPTITSAGQIEGGKTGINYPITIKSLETASSTCGGLQYSWYVNGAEMANEYGASLTWTPTAIGVYQITRRAMMDDDETNYREVTTEVIVYSPCIGKQHVYDAQGNKYAIKEMADTRCWMIQNIRRTDVSHQHAGFNAGVDVEGSNLHYHDGRQAYDEEYGCHYNWNVAMQGSTAEKSQGICPSGWYIPTDAEWKTLSMAYGMTQAQANGTGYQGYNEATQFKVGGSSGFNITLSGYAATSYFKSYGYYWTSTPDGGSAWVRHFTGEPKVYRYEDGKGNMWSVRCIRSQCYQNQSPVNTSPGKIIGGIVGVGYPITIKNGGSAKVTCGGLEYSWYIGNSTTPLNDEVGESLTYTFNAVGTYIIHRRATNDIGHFVTVSDTVRVYAPCAGTTSVYDEQGNEYMIKEMADTRCWMLQNIRRTDIMHYHAGVNATADVDGNNLYYHENEQPNDEAYGCHYNWNVATNNIITEKAQGICPSGWYIPSDGEWKALEIAYGMTPAQTDGTGYRGYNEATQFKVNGSSGFNITFSGYAGSSYFGSYGYYWTSTQSGGNAWARHFTSDPRVYRYETGKGDWFSVRCIRSMCYGQAEQIMTAGHIEGGKVGVNYLFTIKNRESAKANCGGVEYTWFVNGSMVAGEHGAYLKYTFSTPGNYWVVRTATADNGHYQEASATVEVVRPCGGSTSVTDAQGNTYAVKEMADTRCWMTENMRRTDVPHTHAGNGLGVGTDGDGLHDGVQANDADFGCLYQWGTAMQGSTTAGDQGICPSGWHVPTETEWQVLEKAYGMTVAQASAEGWRGFNEGAEFKKGGTSGLDLTLSGYNSNSYFTSYGYYWSATQTGSGTAWIRYVLNGNNQIYRYSEGKTLNCSIRCIKNE